MRPKYFLIHEHVYIHFFNVNNLQVCVLTFFSQNTEEQTTTKNVPKFWQIVLPLGLNRKIEIEFQKHTGPGRKQMASSIWGEFNKATDSQGMDKI